MIGRSSTLRLRKVMRADTLMLLAFPPIRSATVVRQRFFGIFWPLFLAGSERLRDNHRMTDTAHNQHSETRRPSDRDHIVTTGPHRFQPARPEVLR
jgi:hypothetical protein